MSDSVTHLKDELVKVDGNPAEKISDERDEFIVSMNPTFNPAELSEDGVAIALKSMIDEELLGCPSCTRGRPLTMFGEHIGQFFVCKICSDSCPKCEKEELSEDSNGISCSFCNFERTLQL